jgi:hypothetical protein
MHFWDDDLEGHQAFVFSTDVYQPGTPGQPFSRVFSQTENEIGRFRNKQRKIPIRFFAGQNDPADPSHFTICYIMNGVEGLIDGNLKPDGKTVMLAVRGGGPLLEKE